jgi:hypothetical protein
LETWLFLRFLVRNLFEKIKEEIMRRFLGFFLAVLMVLSMATIGFTSASADTFSLSTVYFDNSSAKWNAVYVYRLEPRFQIGDTFKLYTDNSIAHISKAYSYKINGKTFVDIQLIPQTRYSLEHFYDDMSAIDALRMKYDVACALRTQKIRPTLSAANNLRLLISELPFLQKTM